jgi:predicted metal-dependent peptidase
MSAAEEKLTRAKTRLVVRHPWFGLLASRLKAEPSEEVEAFLSDGKVLQYNPDFFAAEPVETAEFALANSVMHHVLAHENRRKNRQGWLWQLATDYAVNGILLENGFRLPERARWEARFAGKYAEEIYAVLKDEIENEEYGDDESDEEGFNEQNKNRLKERQPPENPANRRDDAFPLPPQELAPESERMWEEAMKEALDRAEDQGRAPGGLERLFERGAEGRIDWRTELHQLVQRHLKSDYTYLRPNRKMIASGIYLPSTTSERLAVTVAVDSSGSVDEALLGRFMGELEALLLSFPDTELDVVVCDAKIRGSWRFLPGERPDFKIEGGGGTDFRPVFAYVEAHLPHTALLLYFTDGRGSFPECAPFYETVWVMPEAAEVPFGRTIVLER